MRATILLACSMVFAWLAPVRPDENAFAGKWRIERISGVDAFDAARAAFDWLPDGRIATTVGCNRMIGKPDVHGDRIAFAAMAMTKMACPPPLDDVETKYATALAAARTFRLDGPELTFADDKGSALVVLRRAE